MTAIFNVSLDLNALQAVACAASGEETRYYPKGVFLEFSPTHVHMTATDGHKLITLRQPYQDGDAPRIEADTLPAPVIVPAELIAKLKLPKWAHYFFVTLTVDGMRLTFNCGDAIVGGTAIDATYPAYRNILPQSVSGATSQFNASHLAVFAKARKILGAEKDNVGQIIVQHNGESPAPVNFAWGTGYEAVGVLMPFCLKAREDEARQHIVNWAVAPLSSPMVHDETEQSA